MTSETFSNYVHTDNSPTSNFNVSPTNNIIENNTSTVKMNIWKVLLILAIFITIIMSFVIYSGSRVYDNNLFIN